MGEHETDFAALRREYDADTLDETRAADDPWAQFAAWFADAAASPEVGEANAMVLATVDASGAPSARTVLLKAMDPGVGFTFFTHTSSAKGRDLAHEPRCSLVFGWLALQRQVRVSGVAELVTRDEVQAYFGSRPRSARLGAWASRQSSPVASRAELEAAFEEAAARFGAEEADGPVPVPPTWGGYRVRPTRFEFWQGRPSRLHDRLEYVLDEGAAAGWARRRLAP